MSIDTFDDESLQSNPFHIKNRKELIVELNKVNQIILNQQAELNDLRAWEIFSSVSKNAGLFRNFMLRIPPSSESKCVC